MARIPYVETEAAPAPVREVLERAPVALNIFRLMAHAETCFRPLLRLGASILGQQQLSAHLRELAILRVARLSRAEYEWVQHVPIARAVGASAEQIAALERGDPTAPCFDESERAVLRFTAEVVRDVGCGQPAFDAVAKFLSPREIVELLLAIGYYMMVARLMETLRIDLDPPAGTRIVDQLRGGS
jgi:alkylhydroperoxidase family enzyme